MYFIESVKSSGPLGKIPISGTGPLRPPPPPGVVLLCLGFSPPPTLNASVFRFGVCKPNTISYRYTLLYATGYIVSNRPAASRSLRFRVTRTVRCRGFIL